MDSDLRRLCKNCGKDIGRDRLPIDHEMFIREHEHRSFGISVENRKKCGRKDDEICEI